MSERIADAPLGNWVDRYVPLFLRPLLKLSRADRPIGGWLLLWPCWWSAALVAIAQDRGFPDPWHLLLFLAGAFAMRGAGCTYNDIVDRDIDAKVERTRLRPLPAGEIGLAGAGFWLMFQALVGLAVLLQFNVFTITLGLASVFIAAAYPFMKRITFWPQAVLGLGFGWGALMGWAAAQGELTLAPVLLYAGTVAWIIGYDTIYACQDEEDDALVGVRSTARLFGQKTQAALFGFYLASAALIFLAFVWADAGPVAFAGLLAFTLHLGWQIFRFDRKDKHRCLLIFRSNRNAGAILFAGLGLEGLARAAFGPF